MIFWKIRKQWQDKCILNSDPIKQLEADLAALTARVVALETKSVETAQPQEVAPGEVDFQLMQRLQNRQGEMFDADGVGGSIVYAGDFRNEAGNKQARHMERPVPYLATYDPELLANMLAALGNAQRLNMVQQLFSGPQDRQQLQAIIGNASSGQLYHHLHTLLDAGVIVQPKRGVYAIAPQTAVSLLVIIAASIDITEHHANIKEVD